MTTIVACVDSEHVI